jgi:hypothetical protein
MRGSLRGRQPPHPFPPLPLVKGKGIEGIGLNKDRGRVWVGKKSNEGRG